MIPRIKVVAYRRAGKYYSDKETNLKDQHKDMRSWDFMNLIRGNDPSVSRYSPMRGGFSGEYIYILEAIDPSDTMIHLNCCYIPNGVSSNG